MKIDEITNIDQFKCEDGKYRYIYKILLTETKEYYYGQHTTNDIHDGYMGSGNEVKKYYDLSGFTNVEKDYVCFVNNQTELDIKEKEYIGLGYLKDPLCLNKTPGGYGGWESVNKFVLTTERRSEIMKNYFNSMTEEERNDYKNKCKEANIKWLNSLTEMEKISISNKIKDGLATFNKNNPGFWAGENNPMFGHTHSNESKAKMSSKKIGSNNNRFGSHWYYNPQTNKCISLLENEIVPEGFIRGRKGGMSKPEYIEKLRKRAKSNDGWKWITNGVCNKQLRRGQSMPEGFHYGRIK